MVRAQRLCRLFHHVYQLDHRFVGRWLGGHTPWQNRPIPHVDQRPDSGDAGLLLVILINTTLRRPIVNWFDSLYEQTRNPFYLNTLWLDYVLVFSALALIGWPGLARLIRGQVLSIGEEDYVLAARALGATETHIMLRHVIPNAMGPLIVAVTAGMGGAVLLEASLSFLGIGVQPPNASWGSMLNEGLRLWQVFPHLVLVPAVTIGIVQVAFVFLGDGLNDALDPRRIS